MDINVNTKELDNLGNMLEKLSYELEINLTNLFERLEKMNNDGGTWIGDTANLFLLEISNSKKDYYDFKEALTAYGSHLKYVSNDLENNMKDLFGSGNV